MIATAAIIAGMSVLGGGGFGRVVGYIAVVLVIVPYFFFPLNVALAISLTCALLALFAVGVAKDRVTRLSLRAPFARSAQLPQTVDLRRGV